jgi:ribonuclease Z
MAVSLTPRVAWLIGAAGLAAVLGGLYLARGDIALALASRGAERAMAAKLTDDLPDGLHAVVCGSGSPLADTARAGPCLAVIAGDLVFVVDAGEGSSEVLNRSGLSPGLVQAVFLTHFHSDHIDGLGAMAMQRWVSGGARTPLPLRGPPGVEDIAAGFNQAYRQDSTYRVGHHGAATVPPEGFGLTAESFADPGPSGQVVFEEGGVKVTAFAVDHHPVHPAVGYRFDYKNRSLVISGDTAKDAAVVNNARGADLLVHEALSPRLVGMLGEAAQKASRPNVAKLMADIPDYHTTPPEAAQTAQAAKVGALLLTHLVPPLQVRALEGPFLGDARRRFEGPLWVARDGDVVSLPAGGKEIDIRR